MASEPERNPADEDTVLVGPDERSAAEEPTPAGNEEWPVTDLYYVEPDEAAPERAEAEADSGALVARTAAPVRRRFPPDVSSGVLLALLGVLAALVLGAVFLALDDDPAASTTTPTGAQTTTPTVETTTTPPAAATEEVAVRNVEGMTVEEATAALEEQGLRVRVSRSPSERPQGEVVSQAPPAGAEVDKGTVIALLASTGTDSTPTQVEVPDLVGRSASSAV